MEFSVKVNDLICLANISKKNNIDTIVKDIVGINKVVIEGEHDILTEYAVVGSELVKILSSTIINGNTDITIERRQLMTNGSITVGDHFRTVIVLDDNSDVTLTNWEYTNSIGSVTSNLFPVELSTGTITMKSNLSLWSPMSINQKYKVKPRKTMAYIFKGDGERRILKFSTVVTKIRFNTRGKSEPNKIILDIKDKMAIWYDKDVVINKQLKGTTPKEFFKILFNLTDRDIYYADGVKESSFPQINNLHTKEYKTVAELLKAYCQNGVRFCFDELERVKIFGDFNVDNIDTNIILNYNITDSMLSENEQMIYNTINTKSYQRQTLYSFDDLENKYVNFLGVKRNVVNSNKMLTVSESGNIIIQPLEIINKDIHSSVQLKDYVLLKRTVAPYLEFYARVVGLEKGDRVIITPILYDKDYKLFSYGKNTYLKNLLIGQSCLMDIYYAKKELPIIWKLTRKKNDEESDSSLMIPLLPKVNGEVKYTNEFNCTFGSASNLKVGTYTGITEEVDKIYGTWDNSKLLYNMELTQFSNGNYPPVFALSNKVSERITSNNIPILNYTHFDNSDLLVEIERPSDNSCDAIVKLSNMKNINKDIDLFVGKEIGRFGNKIIQVEDLSPYKLGDVLIVNKPDNLTPQEEIEFDEVLSSIKWTILAKETQTTETGDKHYIFLDSPFAKRQKTGEVYEFTKFPNTSIVFLQELYFRGNPVIEFAQDIVGISKSVTVEGETSKDLYGEKKYEIDSKQLNKENLRLLMGYILDNFQATTPQNTKFNVPISVFNSLDINLLDVVKIDDPVYTQIKNDMKWVVTSIGMRSGTNEINLHLLNINSKNTTPYKIDIKDVIEYQPVEIPNYSHTGSEGNTTENNDGTGGTDIDKSLGQFWLSEVSSEKFRAKVDKFEGNYIYFKEFSGTEYEQYQQKLFPTSEFAVNIKGEVLFVQSDMNYRAFIKKRRVYDTEEVIISPEDDVSFLVTTTYVDIDGTFYGRKMMMGDGDSYLSVDPINGVKIVGDFVVGEGNKNTSNDLWNALNKNKTFQQNVAPISTNDYILKEGDIWYDLDDENHCYRYDGNVWISARDGSIVSKRNSVFIQPDEPINKDGRPIVEGDTWYDSDDGNKPYVYQGGRWVNVTDMTLQDAIDKAQADADKSLMELRDISNDNKVTPDEKKQISLEWKTIESEFTKIKNEALKFGLPVSLFETNYNSLKTYLSTILISLTTTSDINRTVFNGYFLNYYNSRQDLLNSISSKTKKLVDKAQADATTALGNSKIFYQTSAPVNGMKENDLWYDTDDQNHPYIYKNGKWTSARDKIFETEGGNKVYFQSTRPPSSGVGIKEGDMWFDTAHNNTQYILMKQSSGVLSWVLASDANDKIANGRIVLNANTTVNGDFRVRGANVELNANTKVLGVLEVFGGDKGIISYNGTTEANSTMRIIIKGGEILFQERIL